MALIDTTLTKLINESISKVTKSAFTIFSGAALATLTPLTTLPTVDFKVKVTVSGGTSNTGTVVISGSLDGTAKSETLTFTAATTKACTLTLDTITSITTTGLADEATKPTITVACFDTSGAALQKETVTSIKARWQDSTSEVQVAGGAWTASQAVVFVTDAAVTDGTTLRRNSLDYTVQKVSAFVDINGTEKYRKCWLGQLGW